jgi:SAM-dependent methyltransferase
MRLRKPLPFGRTYEQVEHHYLLEKALAERLKQADREERKQIYATMYEELFREVPDHPRLTQRASGSETRRRIRSNLAFIGRFLSTSCVFVEFAPGDCKLLMAVAPLVRQAFGVDISDQHAKQDRLPANLRLIVYDGYMVEGIAPGSADIVFSDQLIEHLHPDDIKLHFEQARRVLKDGGKYVLRTPSALSGPHDVSVYFSGTPQGFHLKEWTYGELVPLLRAVGFSQVHPYWYARQLAFALPLAYFVACEKVARRLPGRIARRVVRYLTPSVSVVAVR